jgi:hypothetical protein
MPKPPPTYTVAHHFTGKSKAVRAIYESLLAAVRQIGRVKEDPKKTSIHLVRTSALAGVEVRKAYLVLNIKTDYPIKSKRVTKSEKLSAKRYHQKVKVSSPGEIDAEVRGWLRDAYEVSG